MSLSSASPKQILLDEPKIVNPLSPLVAPTTNSSALESGLVDALLILNVSFHN